VLGLSLSACTPQFKDSIAVHGFIDNMATSHQFDKAGLHELFASVEIKDDILKKIATPAEAMPWYRYHKIFLTEARIAGGVKFWRENQATLSAVAQQTGVPAEIIVAIIGVETSYGAKTGHYRVIDALSTLAFAYPPRSPFFKGELEHFLLLCREEHKNPLEPTGSYAGAMGMPQFMPSSFRNYALDFDHDKRRDIWQNPGDVIASVAHYFVKHQWQPGQAVAIPVTATGEDYKTALSAGLKPDLRLAELESSHLKIASPLPLNTKVKLLSFELQPLAQKPNTELWAGLDNFYVITRYNHSPLYALAVYQLSLSILNKKDSFP
jgi:membrane-bound lytic murein transglycosylase B